MNNSILKSIIVFVFVFAASGILYCYQKSLYEVPNVNYKSELWAKNGNYHYHPIKKDTMNYIKTLNSGRIYRAKEKKPKVVFYTNVVDTTCPYRRNFQNLMNKYAKSESWGKGYSFVNIDIHTVEELYFVNNQDKREYSSFNNDCDYFCIVDLNKNLIFQGLSNSEGYVNAVLKAFYNN